MECTLGYGVFDGCFVISLRRVTCSDVNLELNNTKCKVLLRVTRRHNKLTYPYKLNNTILESTDCERDLGVLTSSTLTWSQQVDYLCNKATKMLGYVRRSTLNINDTIVRRRLYLCLVRSQLCCQTYGITSKTCNKIHPKFALPL